jgi:hypothetical protein
MSHEVIVVVISREEESDKREYARDDMVPSDFFPETHEDDDIDREDKNTLPPAEYADLEIEIELIDHRESGRRDGDRPDHFQIREVVDILECPTEFLREKIEQNRDHRRKKDPEDSESEYGRIKRHFHGYLVMRVGK